MSSSPVSVVGGPRLLTALAGAQLLVALDFSIVYVALPNIGTSLAFSPANLQWIVSGYAILFAGVLLIGGQLVDVYGGARVFTAAQLLFAASSAAAGASPDSAVLILARGAQGIAAGLLVPATLGLLNAAYPAGPRRNRALSVWGTTGAFGLALGVSAGGVLITIASWRWIFWINLPIVALCLATAGSATTARSAPAERRVTVVTAGSAAASVIAVVFAFSELARPSPTIWVILLSAVTAAASAATVIARERHAQTPLIPRMLLKMLSLRIAAVAAAIYMATFGAEFYLITVFLQDQRGYTPITAGLAFLPLAATIVIGNTLAGAVADRLPHRYLLAISYTTGAAGLAILALSAYRASPYWPTLLAGLLLSGLGQGMAFTGMFIVGTRDLPAESEGTGSALITTAQYTGGSIGLAILVLILGHHPGTASYGLAILTTAAGALLVAPLALRKLP